MMALQHTSIKAVSLADLTEGAERAFAVFDAALIPNLMHLLPAYKIPHKCLFLGKTAKELEDVAPYLVSLKDLKPQAEDFVFEHLSAGNGIVVHTSLNMLNVRTFLKKWLRTTLEDKPVFVKFYTAKNFMYVVETSEFLHSMFEKIDTVISSKMLSDDQFAATTFSKQDVEA